MSKRYMMFFSAVFAVGVYFAFACGGGAKKEEPPPPPPVSTIDKVIWSQEVEKDFEPASGVVVDTSPAQSVKKSLSGPGPFPGPPMDEEIHQVKNMAFFASNPDGTGSVRLTPKGVSVVQLGDGLAPNGDFWYWSKAGIFVANVTEPKPRMIIGTQALATKFTDGAEAGLYWFESMLDAINNHKDKFDDYGWYYNGPSVHFISSDTAGQYIAVLYFPVNYIKVAEGGENSQLAHLWLRYDSASGALEHVLPYMTSTGDGANTTTGEEKDKVETTFSYSAKIKVNQFGSFTTSDFDPDTNTLGYSLIAKAPNSDPYIYRSFDAEYNPITKKHTAFELPHTFNGTSTSNATILNKAQDCKLYQDGVDVPFEQKDCKFTYATGSNLAATSELDARKKTAACMQSAVSGKKIAIKCAPRIDITDFVSSKEKLINLIKLTSTNTAKTIAEVDLSLVKQFEYKAETNNNNNVDSDVECEQTPAENYCWPKYTSVYSGGNSQDGPTKAKILVGYTAYPDSQALFIAGYVKDGNDIKEAIYTLNLTSGALTLVDKSNTSLTISSGALTKTIDGDVFIYSKTNNSTYFKAFFIYSPNWTEPIALTKYVPSSTGSLVSFYDYVDGKKILAYGISYDKKWAFFRLTDDLGRSNTYALDLTKVIPSPVVETEEPAKPEEKKTATAKKAEEGTTVNTPAVTPAPIIGETWVLAHSEVQNKNFNTQLKARVGDKLLWSSNQDGSERIYWNKLDDITLKKLSGQGGEGAEKLSEIAANLSQYQLPVDIAALDISTDILTSFACGIDNPNATYCADPRQMCMGKTCVDMYSCSKDAPMGVCLKYDTSCIKGVCVANSELCGGVLCESGFTCENNVCTPPKPVVTCTSAGDCGKFSLCVDGVCESDDKECYIDSQCGSSANYDCIDNANVCAPKALSLKLTGSSPVNSMGVICSVPGQSICYKYKYTFYASWSYDSNSDIKDFLCTLSSDSAKNELSISTTVTCSNPASCLCTFTDINVSFEKPIAQGSQYAKPVYKVVVEPVINSPGANLTDVTKEASATCDKATQTCK